MKEKLNSIIQNLKPRLSMSKPKLMIFVSIIILMISAVLFIYGRMYSINNSTGAVIVKGTPRPSNDPYVELDKLLVLDEYTGVGFKIKKVESAAKVGVFLDKPYDENQKVFETWLKDAGYGEVPEESFVYFHNP